MKLALEISQKNECSLNVRKIRKVILETVKFSRLPIGDRIVSLSLAFVSPLEIRKLNRIYRKKDSVTDVLSFGEYRNEKELARDKNPRLFLGELIVCCSDVKKSAKINKTSFERELLIVLAHGTLHLLGMDHSQKMFAIQDKVVEKIKQ